jgi:hypothetical protein
MAPLPSDRAASTRVSGTREGSTREAGDEGPVASARSAEEEEETREQFVRRSGDLPHEPPPRPATP